MLVLIFVGRILRILPRCRSLRCGYTNPLATINGELLTLAVNLDLASLRSVTS